MNEEHLNLWSLLAGHDDRPAVTVSAQSWSRAQLRTAACRAVTGLRALGLARGDAVAVWLPNGPAWLQLLFAAADLGVLIVPVSTRYKMPEVRHVLEVSGARALICPDVFLGQDYAAMAAELAEQVASLASVVVLPQAETTLAFAAAVPAAGPSGAGQPADLLCCFSTSGTTGFPKLAAHDHASIARHASLVGPAMHYQPGDRLLAVLPFYGVFGFMAALAALAGAAACDVMAVYDAEDAAVMIDTRGITHVIGSDSMFDPILRCEGHRFASWRRLVQADFVGLTKEVTQRAAAFGISATGTYGSSEAFALCSFWPDAATTEERSRAGGVPVDPTMSFRIVDDQADGSGAALAVAGQAGELQLRGSNVLACYLNNAPATAAAMTADGWFRTGDLARAEGSAFVYLSRMGDSLRLRGYLVNPAEIETVLMQHPAVAGAQVVGVRQPGSGDLAVAYVLAASEDFDEADVAAYCKSAMAAFKQPFRIVRIDEFPSMNGPNGNKIQKRVLREMAAQLVATSMTEKD